jgi:UDP-N-acetylmuramate dehydrogenase
VQNIGAYGREASEVIYKVVAVNINDGSIKTFTNKECCFDYRDSVFKRELKNKYLIVKVFFKLSAKSCFNLNYGSLEQEVIRLGGATLRNVRQAVINIRDNKLPNPKVLGNAGSFFKNPVVDFHKADLLKNAFPEMPVYEDKAGFAKLSAGWLIEKCGWKGKRQGDAGVHEKQALVIVNYDKATGRQIVELSENIKHSVSEMFEVELELEVEIVGSI